MTAGFRFAAILDLRRRERDQAAIALAKVDAALSRVDQQNRDISLQRQSLRRTQKNLPARVISAHQLKSQADFDLALQQVEITLSQERQSLQTQLQEAHDQLVTAQQEVARLEKLEQINESRQRAKLRRRQQQEYDATIAARQTK